MLTPEQVTEIAQAHGLDDDEAVALRVLADDVETAHRHAARLAETKAIARLFGRVDVVELDDDDTATRARDVARQQHTDDFLRQLFHR